MIAGVLIGISAFTYVCFCAMGYKILGAFMFAFGLYLVCTTKSWLFTGKCGFFKGWKESFYLLTSLMLNAVFALVTGWFLHTIGVKTLPNFDNTITSICINKFVNTNYGNTFVAALFCGAMMYFAVTAYKIHQNFISVMLPVAIFILCGGEHSIANIAYAGLLGVKTTSTNFVLANADLHILLAIAGNFIGSNLIRFLVKGDSNICPQ